MTLHKRKLLQPVRALKPLSLKRANNSWMPEKAVLPQTHLIHYAPKTQHTLPVLSEMVASKIPLTLDIGCPSSLGSSFVIEVQAHARGIELERIC